MSTEISREANPVAVTTDMTAAPVMTKGTKLYASTKDNHGDAVKDANLTFQWYRGGSAIDGATSSSYTLGDDDIKKFTDATKNIVTYRVVVNGKDGYTGTAKDTINIKGAINDTPTVRAEDISVKKGDTYLAKNSLVNAGDTLTLAASYADSLNAMNVVWWYSADGKGDDTEQFTGTSFTVPSTANKDSKIAVSVTLKDADKAGMWKNLKFNECTTTTTAGKNEEGTAWRRTADLTAATDRVVYTAEPDLTNGATGTLKCAKALDSIAVTYKVANRTLTAPEVGATMTVSVQPQLADLSYKWEVDGETVDSNDNGTGVSDAEAGDGANSYTIKRADVNKKIKVTVTAGNDTAAYKGVKLSYESEAVAASSRTISAIKVLKYDKGRETEGNSTDTWYVKAGDEDGDTKFLNDKADFVNKKSVSAIMTNQMYIIVAMDSDGELIDSDVSYNLYDFKSGVEKKVTSLQRFSGSVFDDGDVAHFEVAPNMVGYVGSAVSYNLSSAVKDAGEAEDDEEISLTIAPKATPATTDAKTASRIIAEGANITFKATLTGVDGNPSIKWFNGNGDQKGVGTEFNPGTKGLTELADGGFYAEITVGGTTYTSQDWTIQKRVSTSLNPTSLTDAGAASTTAGNLATTVNILDQFGQVVTPTAFSATVTQTVAGVYSATQNAGVITVARAASGNTSTGETVTILVKDGATEVGTITITVTPTN